MPDDTTPHGGEALHPLPDRARIPEPKPGAASDTPMRAEPVASDPAERPQPPEHPRAMAADLQPADPAEDSGAADASASGKPSVTRQPG